MRRVLRKLCIVLAGAFVLAACSDDAPEHHPPPHKLLVIGWDGATFQMIDPLLAQGRLPNLAKLIERGSQSRLESTKVPISSAAWVGAVTGKTPGQNGVYSFFEPIAQSYDVRLISSRSNRAAPLWRVLGWNGMKSLVFNVPITYPPEKIDGTMVGGMLSPFDAEYAHPKGLTEKLRERGFVPDLGAWREKQQVTFARVEEQLALKQQILVEMLARDDWDFAMVVFKDLDVWSHRAYDADPNGTIGRHYELLDGVLGQLLASCPSDTNVVVMSDHGFEPYHRSFFVQRWLVEHGFAVERDGVQPKPQKADNLAERRALDHQQLIASLDLSRTVAFSAASEGNYGGIRLNVAGREPQGALAAAEVEAKLDELSRALLATKLPGTDQPLVTRTYRSSELYPGPFAAQLPDLIFELDPSVAARNENLPVAYGEHKNIYPDHHLLGVFFASGPAFAHVPERGDVSIFDLAPTALHVLGLPVYSEMTGVVRRELLADKREPRVVSESADPRAQAARAPRFVETSGDDAAEIESRLRELGYVR
jgi:predicted AlkP superfamily phosphohydrolase/phosphomutase